MTDDGRQETEDRRPETEKVDRSGTTSNSSIPSGFGLPSPVLGQEQGMTITVPLAFGAPLVEATFVSRHRQVVVYAQLGDEVVRAHMADRGRLLDLLVPGRRLVLAHRPEPGRKTAWQVVAAYGDDGLESLDTHLPNRLIRIGLEKRALLPFARYTSVRREVTLGDSRFDFVVEGNPEDEHDRCVVEVKSVGLLHDGIGFFPDAPTSRGLRHVLGLMTLAKSGTRAAVVFVVQGEQVHTMRPDATIDPALAEALREAVHAGVEVYAYACPFHLGGLTLGGEVPVEL